MGGCNMATGEIKIVIDNESWDEAKSRMMELQRIAQDVNRLIGIRFFLIAADLFSAGLAIGILIAMHG
jgi:hypothetical protein